MEVRARFRVGVVLVALVVIVGGVPAVPASAGVSSEGPRIVFGSDRDGNDEVYVVAAEAGTPVNITNNPASDTSPAPEP